MCANYGNFLTNSLTYIRSFRIQTLHYPRISSSNDLSRLLFESGKIAHGTVIRADFQENGRGQMGNTWLGNEGENIYMSLVLELQIPVEKQFLLNMAVSLAVLHCVKTYLPEAKIKWPNDILVDRQKLAGILVENSIQGQFLTSTVIGIGLNVNQKSFGSVARAASLSTLAGKDIYVEDVYPKLTALLEWQLYSIHEEWRISKEYHENLLLFGSMTTFEKNGRLFKGKVLGVDEWGRLRVEENEEQHVYAAKELRWVEL